jgi:type I restriction enzyme R subunit
MSERSAVQNPMLAYAEAMDWRRITASQALEWREGEKGLFFGNVLREQLLALNPGIVAQDNVDEIIRQLGLIKPTIQGNQAALSWMKGEQSIFLHSEKRERNVVVFDFEHEDRNIFHVTDEWVQQGVAHRNRADVVFLINGLPVAIAETKSAHKPEALAEGIDQIRRYHRETPEMFIHTQLFEVTELIRFFYGVSWNVSRKGLFNWKDEAPAGTTGYEATIKTFFDRTRFLNVLKHYINFLTIEENLVKIILRQHQTRAVEKVIHRVEEKYKSRGLVWHTQGSGKTLTMITIAARLIREDRSGEKPTVIMLIDRNELEGQLEKNLIAYGLSQDGFVIAGSKKRLQELLASDYRGLIVSMIHKFDKMPANINTREGVVVLVDEAHRTTGGRLGIFLMGALPNATYIGFTGTPIDKLHKGEGTFKVFGVDDERGYLDKYSVRESIEDGTTLELNYALAPSEMRVEKDTLEREFLNLADAEGVTDIEELNAVLDKAVALKELMKNSKRIDAIASFVAKHYAQNVEPMGFKAFLVGVDREACCLYKEALDKYLPPEYSQVVYSSGQNDGELLKKYQIDAEQEKDIRKRFVRKNGLPKILIVTEKLLTGFDAPILYALYLDKPMRDHVLLQTIARVNRPYEDDEGLVKPYGFVLDFVGIFERLEKALAFDADVVESCIQNIDVLKQLFATKMKDEAPQHLAYAKGFDDKAKDRAIQHYEPKIEREAFFKFFRELQRVYDVLSPDVFLRPYLEDFERIAALYALIRNAYAERPYVDKELSQKTREILREHSSFSGLEVPGQIHKISEEELKLLANAHHSDTSKILNLRKILSQAVHDHGDEQPFLISISERAQHLAELYEDRQLTTQDALAAFMKLAGEVAHADEEMSALGLEENAFAIYTALKPAGKTVTSEQAIELNKAFEHYPDYQWNQREQNTLKADLMKLMMPIFGKDRIKEMVATVSTLLRLRRV